MTEDWRDIPGYEGTYQISNLGRIRKIMVRKSHLDSRGRPRMILSKGGKTKNFPVSVLVALAFKGPRPSGTYVCHNDGDCTNNSADNLRYDTPKANSEDRAKHGRTVRGEKHSTSKLTESDVMEIRRLLDAGESQVTVSKRYGVSQSLVSSIGRREIWTHV